MNVKEYVTFTGEIGAFVRPVRQVVVRVKRGSKAHLFAMTLAWLTQRPAPTDEKDSF